MTPMTQDIWDNLTPQERRELRSDSALTPQLIGLEGWRVEVLDHDGNTRRFLVGKSTGWVPCHIELHNIRCYGGGPARKSYQTVKPLYRQR